MPTEAQRARMRSLYKRLWEQEPRSHTVAFESCSVSLGEEEELEFGEHCFFRVVYQSDEGSGRVTFTLPRIGMPDLRIEVDGEEAGEIPLGFGSGFRVGNEDYATGKEAAAESKRRVDGILPTPQERAGADRDSSPAS